MNLEEKINELESEVRALKATYAQASNGLIVYTYELDESALGPYASIRKTLTFDTEDGSNTIASIEGVIFDRMPYDGGARFWLVRKIKPEGEIAIKLHAMQKGTISIS